MAQLSESQLATIRDHPIGDALNSFRAAFGSAHPRASLRGELDHFQQLVAQPARRSLVLRLIGTLQLLPATDVLTTADGGLLGSAVAHLYARLLSNQTDVKPTAQLVKHVIDEKDDPTIWVAVYDLIRRTQPAPPPTTSPTSLPTEQLRTPSKSITPATHTTQTPNTRTTSAIANSSEHRKHFDNLLKAELDHSLFIGVPNFFETFFGEVESLQQTAATVFRKCNEGNNPLYMIDRGWRGWPTIPTQNNVLGWFTGLVGQLKTLAEKHCSVGNIQRGTLAKPDQPFEGSVAERRMDLGFAHTAAFDKPRWSEILVVGELKSNKGMDKSSDTWHDLARYAREVFTAQCTRRFVLGFTLCGSIMRLWEFDRTGGIASEPFDINEDGLRFVSAIMGYLLMHREQLGFDPTILKVGRKWMVEIAHNDQTERLVLGEVITRVSSVASRGTTCWKAYREGDNSRRPYVVKDSWQYPERDEEGELLKEATEKEVVNVARHYHHETVYVAGIEDDVCNNIRKGLDVSKATNYRPSDSMPPPSTSGIVRDTRSTSSVGQKRSSSQIDTSESASKRTCSGLQQTVGKLPKNRVHRRLVLGDYGKPIYEASSRAALLAAMEGCIEGHRSLYKKGKMLQRDISQNNLMINEEESNHSWKAFLIDLDLAIRTEREGASGARGKTGTLAFMAIGVLSGEQHTFMHDLESFFWVLFWICIHYEGPGKGRVVERFEKWNFLDTEELAGMKLGVVADESIFWRTVTDHFTEYYQPLIPCIDELRKAVFPNGGRWKQEEPGLYSRMMDILREARKVL